MARVLRKKNQGTAKGQLVEWSEMSKAHETEVDMYCSVCGKQLDDEARFCPTCGSPVKQLPQEEQPFPAQQPFPEQQLTQEQQPFPAQQLTQEQRPPQAPQERRTSVLTRLLAVLVIVLSGAIAVLLVVIFLPREPNTTLTAEQHATEDKEQSATNGEQAVPGQAAPNESTTSQAAQPEQSGEPEQPTPTKPTNQQLAAEAYAAVLQDADSYFAQPWFDQYPDSEVTYTLLNLTDDDLPELLLCAHYSNVGTHTSGGQRMIPFVYDPESGTAIEATSDEFSLFADPWNIMQYNAGMHCFELESRYRRGTNSEFYREYVSGTSLVREQISADEAQGGEIIGDGTPLSDRTTLNNMVP